MGPIRWIHCGFRTDPVPDQLDDLDLARLWTPDADQFPTIAQRVRPLLHGHQLDLEDRPQGANHQRIVNGKRNPAFGGQANPIDR
jgi:hypothetical protein